MQHTKRVLCLVTVLSLWIVAAPSSLWAASTDPKPDENKPDAAEPKKVWKQLRPDRLISESSSLYISVPDIGRAKSAFMRSAFHGLLSEDEILTPLVNTFNKTRDALVKGDGTLAEMDLRWRNDFLTHLTKLYPYIDGQAALDVEDFAKPFKFLVVISMPPGDAGDERQRVLDNLFERYRFTLTTDPRFRDFDDVIDGYNIHRIENSDLQLVETWAFVENLLIYGQGKNVVEDAIHRYMKNGAGTLSLHQGYQSAYNLVARDEHIGPDGHPHLEDSLLYIQVGKRAILQVLGLLPAGDNAPPNANEPSIAIGMQVGDGDNAPVRERILIKEAPPKITDPCRATTARFTPSDTLFYTGWNGNLENSYGSIVAFVNGLKNDVLPALNGTPKPAAGGVNFEQQLCAALKVGAPAQAAAALGIFKGEMSLMIAYVPQANVKVAKVADLLSDFTMVFAAELDSGIAGGQQFKNLMAGIENETGQPYLQAEYKANNQGYMIRYQQGMLHGEEKKQGLPMGLLQALSMPNVKVLPFFAAYAIIDLDVETGAQARKFVLFSDSVDALKKALSQSGAVRSSLFEDKKFKTLVKSFRESYQITYADLNRLVDVYAAALPILSKTGAISREALAQFPNANLLNQHLYPMAAAQSVDADRDGVLYEFSSPTGNLTLAGMIGSVLYPAINEEKKKKVSGEVDDKFKRINVALQLYASDFDRYPLQLSDLHVPAYDHAQPNEMSLFESPFKRNALAGPQDIDNPELTNLIYIPSRQIQGLAREIILYEREPTMLVKSTNEGSKLLYHVLTVDGKMTGLPRATLERRLGAKLDMGNPDKKP